jgi:S-adenosyl-L-methionine hydrolase (adenosine-forming)
MSLVTITSDLGTRDHYLAALKGAIYCSGVSVPIVDITHDIKPFDLKEAAFIVRNAYGHFPKGTIHIVHINAANGKNRLLLAVAGGHYFITFDNGFLSLAFDKVPHETYQVNDELLENNPLLSQDAIGKVVNLLLKEYKPTDFAHLTTETRNLMLMQPITTSSSIRGTVVHIDNFSNAVVNITRTMFEQFAGEKRFTIMANAGSSKMISKDYSDVDEGDMVCLFNAAGYLEIAINKGKAENLLGLKIDSPVLVMLD